MATGVPGGEGEGLPRGPSGAPRDPPDRIVHQRPGRGAAGPRVARGDTFILTENGSNDSKMSI